MSITPAVYTPKVLGDVDAVLFPQSASVEETEEIRVWLRSLFGDEAVPAVNQMNRFIVTVNTPNWSMQVPMEHYLLWDGLNLQLVPRLVFELIYTPGS